MTEIVAPPAVEAANAVEGQGIIVVTAQSRLNSRNLAPVAITSVTPDETERRHVQSIFDLNRIAPDAAVRMGSVSASTQISIRGIGTASNTAIEPSVATFVDGIYIPRTGAMVGAFLDLAGGEVLRGPQGTLFGRNASAGALSLFTATPKAAAGLRLTQEVGTADRFKVDGVINVPLSADASLRIAGLAEQFGGFWHNRFDHQRYGGRDTLALRGSLKLDLGAAEWLLRADYAKVGGDGFVAADFDRRSVSAAQFANLKTLLGGALPDTNLNDTTVNQVVVAQQNDRNFGFSSKLSLDLGASRLLVVSGLRRWRNNQSDGDSTLLPISVLSRQNSFASSSFSQELQYISPARGWLGGRLDLVAGLYLFHETFRIGESLVPGSQFCNLLIRPAGERRDACNAALAAGGAATDLRFAQSTTSLAAYGQANIYLGRRLSLSLGARFTRDSKDGTFDQQVPNPFAERLRAVEALTLPPLVNRKVSGTLRLNYTISDHALAFAGYSSGFKSGGYNSGGGSPSLSTFDATGALVETKRTFRPETVTDMHVGFKVRAPRGGPSASLLFYRMDVHDYQDRAVLGTTFLLGNSGDLRQQGIDFEANISPARGFTLSGAVAYLDSRFLTFPTASGLPGLGGTQDLTGKRARFSPEWSGSFAASWQGQLTRSGLGWEVSAHTSFVSSQYLGPTTDANPQTIEPAYALLGARISLKGRDDRWALALFGDNLTDRHYANFNAYQILDGAFGLRNGAFPGSTAIRKLAGNPRTFGASLTFRFGSETKAP